MLENDDIYDKYLKGTKELLATEINETESNYSEEYEDYEYEEAGVDYHRIVRGYEPLERPWMALIYLHGRHSIGTCGGSLLNHRYI